MAIHVEIHSTIRSFTTPHINVLSCDTLVKTVLSAVHAQRLLYSPYISVRILEYQKEATFSKRFFSHLCGCIIVQ